MNKRHIGFKTYTDAYEDAQNHNRKILSLGYDVVNKYFYEVQE
jgi:hypothetical protein